MDMLTNFFAFRPKAARSLGANSLFVEFANARFNRGW